MPDVRLATPRIEVILDDGTTLVAQALNVDLVRWDRTAAKHSWPSLQAAPFLWLTFIAWSALRRDGQIPDALTWEQFVEGRCVQVRNLTEEEGTAATDGADPTLAGATLG